MKKKLILMSMLLTTSQAFASISLNDITKALTKYCVPKPNDVYNGTAVCGSEFESKYTAGKNCGCYNSNFMTYDESLRHCIVKCPAGTHPRLVQPQTTKKCPGGMQAVVYNPNKPACPFGYNVIHTIKR
ncbi:MAG: hypothetical protein K6F04_02970 [bacterium]|nr:hypothetical protein [bacterium]